MQNSNLHLHYRYFLRYKLLNALFTGLSVGIFVTLYAPIQPSVFSLGGIVLALGMLLVAKLYTHILHISAFYRISLSVEVLMFLMVGYYLCFPYGHATALLIYMGYQLTFVFGSYIVRAETLLMPKSRLLTLLDVAKQKGYLLGLGLSYLFYEGIVRFFDISSVPFQVYLLHLPLGILQVAVLYTLMCAFTKKN